MTLGSDGFPGGPLTSVAPRSQAALFALGRVRVRILHDWDFLIGDRTVIVPIDLTAVLVPVDAVAGNLANE